MKPLNKNETIILMKYIITQDINQILHFYTSIVQAHSKPCEAHICRKQYFLTSICKYPCNSISLTINKNDNYEAVRGLK